MLETLGLADLDDLVAEIIPETIRERRGEGFVDPVDEAGALAGIQAHARANRPGRSLIGLGYHGVTIPQVIERNVLTNPGWYTAYTPYQPEIAQGRLELLTVFQQVVTDLTGMELAGASLLDEATAAAEAMALCLRVQRRSQSRRFFVADGVLPQTVDVVTTRARHLGVQIVTGPADRAADHDVFAALVQYPAADGRVWNPEPVIAALHERGAMAVVATDLLAMTLLRPPGEMGADAVVGSAQRLGTPMGFGGPHAGYLAVREVHKRALPGRLIGVARDRRGRPAYRMALQTREQHIRREKATSNICTAQVLLANLTACYAIWHGPQGLRRIAERIHAMTGRVAAAVSADADSGLRVRHREFFDTLTVSVASAEAAQAVLARAEQADLLLRRDADGCLGLSLDETVTPELVEEIIAVLTGRAGQVGSTQESAEAVVAAAIPRQLRRESDVLTHPVFHEHRSETEMMRYLKRLENRDLTLTHSMIPLGSCTMKLNSAVEMAPVTWPGFAEVHPFAPRSRTAGYHALIEELSTWLRGLTGFEALSVQPNSGAQGEYAGLLAIRRYQEANGEVQRDICLIPASAHGTNPASAQMAGLRVVVVDCADNGDVDLDDLAAKAEQAGDRLSCLMLTYPSTHGVFEQGVRRICDLIHAHGGQVYLDGANLNAQVGLARPGDYGADVAHLNLHKTFAIPHGGGGPGVGPIGVRGHLAAYLPGHVFDGSTPVGLGWDRAPASAVSAAPFGSASILPISWMYLRLLGSVGVRHSSQVALLAANYLADRLDEHFPVLYRGENGRVAHECILDLRAIRRQSGISETDVAKRLMDYGFHAPTMSFPVPGTLMVEPTESESLAELDRFVAAMVSIRGEIDQVAQGRWPLEDNPLVNAPHTQADILADWTHPYSRQVAVHPLPWVGEAKFWPSVNRIDEVWGDRNLFCSCPAPDQFADPEGGVRSATHPDRDQ